MKWFWISIYFIVGPAHEVWASHSQPEDLARVQVPSSLKKQLKSFEPSSAVYLKDLGRYAISSDDTDKKETPYLFLMDSQGQVEPHPLQVQGLKAMTDIESLSEGPKGQLYLLSSLSINKDGENKLSRNLFVEVNRRGSSLVMSRQVELRSLLLAALLDARSPELDFSSVDLPKELDIESHFIWNGELYLGLKKPQLRRHQALIVNVGSVEVLLQKKRIERLSLWRSVDFSMAGSESLLSDLQRQGQALYLTTSSDQGDPGGFWRLDLITDKLTRLHSFAEVKPEGLALHPDSSRVMIVFDQGLEAPLFFLGLLP